MDKICEPELCTSCLACYSICPADAINIVDEQGFYKPSINNNLCINCRKCKHVCPANHDLPDIKQEQKVFACYVKDEDIRTNSSSGGFFSHIAAHVLNEKGIVFGAGFAENLQIKHFAIDNLNDLPKLRASKYVQSYIGETFKQTKELLEQGRRVLFSGTPCQIEGLKNYLANTDTQNLLLIDLVCHGVPSPQVYKNFLAYLENLYDDKISKVNFRHKPNGWKSFGMKIDFASGSSYFKDLFEDPYLIGFLKNYFLNQSCYTCKYAKTNRPGDITIADFWGYRDNEEITDDDRGITLVITNTQKGLETYKEMAKDMVTTDKTMAEAVAGNASLDHPTFKNKRYDEFWQDHTTKDFAYLTEKYFTLRKRPVH